MIFENELEKKAFDYAMGLASELTDKRGCNDLNQKELEVFGHLKVKSEDTDGSTFMRDITMDFDVCQWLQEQVKK